MAQIRTIFDTRCLPITRPSPAINSGPHCINSQPLINASPPGSKQAAHHLPLVVGDDQFTARFGGPLTFATLYLIFKQLSSDSHEFRKYSQMAKTVDTTGFDQNRNSSDFEQLSVPIRDHESELLQERIKKVVGGRTVRAFARDAKIGVYPPSG